MTCHSQKRAKQPFPVSVIHCWAVAKLLVQTGKRRIVYALIWSLFPKADWPTAPLALPQPGSRSVWSQTPQARGNVCLATSLQTPPARLNAAQAKTYSYTGDQTRWIRSREHGCQQEPSPGLSVTAAQVTATKTKIKTHEQQQTHQKIHTHKKPPQPTDMPDLVSSKTEMTTPKPSG